MLGNHGLIPNTAVTSADLQYAIDIYGPDICILKGKTLLTTPDPAHAPETIPLLAQI